MNSSTLRRCLFSAALVATAFLPARAAETTHWVGSWACAPVKQPKTDKTSYANVTVRNIVHLSLGGSAVRIKISNQFGATSLNIDDAHIALGTSDGKIDTQTAHAITFGGQTSVAIPPRHLRPQHGLRRPPPSRRHRLQSHGRLHQPQTL